ncbi:PTS system sorbose subfamily IIB component [Coriobacterium glomerans PW2]|uniref:PTS system sorbose subfamily IIB component n=1 Tax=Coriobacterium glomerans (strain ATCC 49209 / DSM 20642 / JCM 10262 / PW2) TaxID=700015 RepID=F2N8E9_CORGP|nr:PTS sugar transporter subunit IIB [Coriobacterium glomerans]AEB07332.1 PTS system sorbose subfamily IIB component [Coriobacterium glomerans PW2]
MIDSNLRFVRIDDRLIHGQVITAWLHAYHDVTHILVVDDDVSADPFMRQMFGLLVPSGITIDVTDVAGAIELCAAGLPRPTMMLVKYPLTVKRLIDGGVSIEFLNIGGMGMAANRKKFFQNVAASDLERQILKELIDSGMKVEIQIVPAQKQVDVASLLR